MKDSCPVCGAPSLSEAHSQVPDYEHGLPARVDYALCASCGSLVRTPEPELGELLSYYPDDYRPHATHGAMSWMKAIQSRMLVSRYSHWLPEDREAPILDLGCGSGGFLRALAAAGYRNLTGIDRNPKLAGAFEGTAIRFHAAELEPEFRLDDQYQVIVMNYVLEHFLDPEKILARCREALLVDGRIVVLLPNPESLSHRFFGRYWSGLHAPRHTRLFSPRALELIAGRLGFRETHVEFVTDPGSWAISFQNRVRSLNSAPGLANGTAWYGLASLPFWYPAALLERGVGRSASFMAALLK